MINRSVLLQIIILFSTSSTAWAEKPLLLEDVLRSLNKSFPLILAAETENERAAGDYRASLGEFDVKWKSGYENTPEGYYNNRVFKSTIEKPLEFSGANVYGGYRRGTGNFPDYEGKDVTTTSGEILAGLRLPLLRDRSIDRRRASMAAAELGINLAEAQVAEKKIDIARKAATKYWIWVNFGRRLEISEQLLKTAKVRDAGLSQRAKQGDLPIFELKDNQRNVLQRETQLVQSQRDLQSSSIELSLYLRDELGQPILPQINQLPSKIASPDMSATFVEQDLVSIALTQRPEPKAISLAAEQTEIENRLQQNQLQPKLDLNFEVSNDIGDGQPTREPTEVIAGVNLEVPLQRRTAEGKIIANEAKLSKLRQELRFQKDQIKTEIADAISAILNARSQVEITRKEVAFAEELEQGERDKFSAGDSTILFVNIREQATADSRVRELDALTRYQLARVALNAAMGSSSK